MLGPQQQRVVLLVLGTPDLEDGQRFVSDRDVPYLDLRPRRLHDFLEHVAIAASALVVDADDRIVIAELDAGAQDPVDLLLHLGVAALYRVEVQLGHVLALHHARRRASAHPDAVGGSAYLHDPHPGLGRVLLGVSGVDLSDSAAEHDRLDPLSPSAVREPHPERARISLDHRLAELVAVVRGPVGGLDFDLEGRGEVGWIAELRVFPRKLVARNVEVAHAVGRGASDHQRALPGRVDVADAPAGARLGARERGHTRGEVVGLGREDHMVFGFGRDHSPRLSGLLGHQGPDSVSPDAARIVLESDDAVARIRV